MRRTLLAICLLAAVAAGAYAAAPLMRGLSLVIRAADMRGPARWIADAASTPVREREVRVGAGADALRARVYEASGARQTVLLVSGLHPAGIDEPRLVRLAHTLAGAHVTVVTPDIPELSRFEITPAVTDRIEAAARWLAVESGLAPAGRIGLMGVSFSGGLAIVAAGRPSLRDHLLYVFSFGGHDDLRRVLEFFCSGSRTRVPHDYGLAVVALNLADQLVPPAQRATFAAAMRRYLWASYLDVVDKPAAAREFDALRALAQTLPEPSALLLTYVNDRDVSRLGPRLRPFISRYVGVAALSPVRSAPPDAPVFLLHGRTDTVIPASESESLAARLRGVVPVHLLVTDLISHAEADQPVRALDVMKLAAFWGELLTP